MSIKRKRLSDVAQGIPKENDATDTFHFINKYDVKDIK